MQSDTMKNLFFKSLRSKQILFTIIFTTLFVTVVSLVIYEGNKKTVTLTVNGQQEQYRTHASTVGKLLSEYEIEVSEHDIVTPSVNTPIKNGLAVRWEQSKQVAITVDKENTTLWTTKQTVGEALDEAGIELTEHDRVSPDLATRLDEKNSVIVDKAYEFTLIDGGKENSYWSTSTTIGDFLKSKDIQLGELDRLEGDLDNQVKPGSVVQIVRVEKATETVEEEENFAVETKSDDSLLKGREKVVQQGQKGIVSREYEIIKEDGKEVTRSLIDEVTVKKPTKKIVAVGTKVVVASAAPTKSASRASAKTTSVSRNNSAPSGGKEFYVSATAYTAGCSGCSGITATGINLKANPNLKVIAVDPSVIPLGSKVWVEGYGYAVAGDTGGAIKGNRIDLHVPTKQAAYNFGKRQVKIKIID
ncbi:G5 and 3D domain-containing protein [Sporosarcina ureilytica]|uniref:G5 domain-containing protein n=1 Tax=Sporosarcina ureilytica TaxID=298596 RepID=A0A1D8JC87_9BACL|nr:G5 and 3D domain-containing protein [Sporosarcina ureilytica]AOV06320.1 hypothetical protein BI350_00915 [Sporosarcina ureilytica]